MQPHRPVRNMHGHAEMHFVKPFPLKGKILCMEAARISRWLSSPCSPLRDPLPPRKCMRGSVDNAPLGHPEEGKVRDVGDGEVQLPSVQHALILQDQGHDLEGDRGMSKKERRGEVRMQARAKSERQTHPTELRPCMSGMTHQRMR